MQLGRVFSLTMQHGLLKYVIFLNKNMIMIEYDCKTQFII